MLLDFLFFMQKASCELRISDWSSDVCSSDLLAHSTVGHLGLVTMLFGFGTPIAAVAGVFHILNHATFKCALFMTAGIVDHETGTRDARRLGGLAALMPITATIATVAGLSRSEEHTSELQSLMRISYAVFCLKKKNTNMIMTQK